MLHNLVWVLGDCMDAAISPFSPQPWSHLLLPSSGVGPGWLGLAELKLLFPFVSCSGFVLQLRPEGTRGPPRDLRA